MLTFDLKPAPKLTISCARFDAPEDFAACLAGPVAALGTRHWGDDNNSFHGAGRADTLDRATRGDAARVALSDAMLGRLEDAVGFEARRWRAVDSVAGGAPNVSAFLAGSPMAMRRRVRTMDAAAPLTIAIEMTVSAAVDDASISRRGAAALALARIAAASRPVTLWAVFGCKSGLKHAAFAVRIETSPLDVSRAAWMLCAPEMCRRAAFSVSALLAGWDNDNESVQWMRDHNDTMAAILPELTGDSDLVTVAGFNIEAGKRAFASDDDAAAWVRDMLKLHGAVERA
jgi:hypothetical protein